MRYIQSTQKTFWGQFETIFSHRNWKLQEIIAIICVRIFVRYYVKSFDNSTALKRLSINGHFLWVRKSHATKVLLRNWPLNWTPRFSVKIDLILSTSSRHLYPWLSAEIDDFLRLLYDTTYLRKYYYNLRQQRGASFAPHVWVKSVQILPIIWAHVFFPKTDNQK